MKGLYILLGSSVLCGIVFIIIGYSYWSNHKNEITNAAKGVLDKASETVQVRKQEGEKFGKTSTQRGCLDQSINLATKCEDAWCHRSLKFFLESCLLTASRDGEFCSNMPSETNFIKLTKMGLSECKDYDRETMETCGRLMAQAASTCEEIQQK